MTWVLLLCLFFFCCTGRKEEKVVFAVGGAPAELQAWEELVRDFQRKSGIRVELLRQPADTDQQRQSLVIALGAGRSDPDVFLMDVIWIGLFAQSGWLEPLSSVDPSPFFERVLRLADTHKDRLIALPVYMDGGILYYREDLLRKFGIPGPPKSWEGLLSSSLAIQKEVRKDHPPFYGFVWQGAQYEGLICNFMEMAGAEGGFSFTSAGKVVLHTPANLQALRLMHDLIWRYRVSPPNTFTEMKEEEARIFFQEGDALYERNWPYAWNLHQTEGSKVRGKAAIAPLPGAGKGGPVSTLGGWHIALSRFSDVKPQAMEFIRYVISYEGQKKMVLRLGWTPGRQDLYSDPEILAKMPHLKDLGGIFQNARPRPVLPYYTQVSEIAQRWINGALAGRYAPREALVNAEKEIAALLSRYQVESGRSSGGKETLEAWQR